MDELTYSIIIPVYNRQFSILKCITSCIDETRKDYEIIIIDDGSLDETLNYIIKISSESPQIKIYKHKINKGVNAARNTGLVNSKGKFIIFIDSDDFFYQNYLYKIDLIIERYPHYNHYLFKVSDRINDKELPLENKEIFYHDWLKEDIKGDFTHIIKSQFLKQNKFDESISGLEGLNWLRVFKLTSPQLFISEVICYRDRNRNDSLTSKLKFTNDDWFKDMNYFFNKYLEYYFTDLLDHNVNKLQIKSLILKAAVFNKIMDDKVFLDSLYEKLNKVNSNVWILRIVKLIPPFLLKLLVKIKIGYIKK